MAVTAIPTCGRRSIPEFGFSGLSVLPVGAESRRASAGALKARGRRWCRASSAAGAALFTNPFTSRLLAGMAKARGPVPPGL